MSEQFGQYVVSDANNFLNMRCGQPAPYYLETFSNLYNQSKMIDMPNDLFQYGKKDGFNSFKRGVKKMMDKFSLNGLNEIIKPEHIYMTNGVTHAVQMLTSYFKSGYLTDGNPINTIFIEELTYFLIKTHLENIGIEVKTFSFENLEKLETEVKNYDRNDINIAFYIIPFVIIQQVKRFQMKKYKNSCQLRKNI